ncbi:hypothetical protein [Oribacterium sp. P6A1]|uniref:hypothetical protein n=1 Tax=Oribacterium sp. P6A1 TaxID=1410612 RepID=UPI00055FB481|nr:hypothetical protein [Oribacterium sp. P6A1]
MLYIIVYGIVFLIFLGAPLPFQIVFMIINIFIPDPIPVVDEALMAASIIKKLAGAERIIEFSNENPKVFKIIIVGMVIVFGIFIKMLIS